MARPVTSAPVDAGRLVDEISSSRRLRTVNRNPILFGQFTAVKAPPVFRLVRDTVTSSWSFIAWEPGAPLPPGPLRQQFLSRSVALAAASAAGYTLARLEASPAMASAGHVAR